MISISELKFPKLGTSAEMQLSEELILEQWIVPKDTKVKLYHGEDFGYVILQKGQKDLRGSVIPRRLFKY